MDIENARRLLKTIPVSAKVVDVGGGAAPFPRADYVIDAMPYEKLGAGSDGNIHEKLGIEPRYSEDRWIQTDLCDRRPWPIADKAFDFAICSHLLEDIRDPIWVCSELRRISKAGYIESPSRMVEQSKGVENPRHAGYYHHRWLIKRNAEGTGVSAQAARLTFREGCHRHSPLSGAAHQCTARHRNVGLVGLTSKQWRCLSLTKGRS